MSCHSHSLSTARTKDDVVQHSAATLTCAAETAGDFGGQCVHDQEELALDLPFLRLALEIWREHPAPTQPLVAALEELLSERVRYQQAQETDAAQHHSVANVFFWLKSIAMKCRGASICTLSI
jgi:hypothetical protein